MDTILWSGLGPPSEPGDVRVEGVGIVTVTQENIDGVKELGGDPEFELMDATSMGDKTRRYLLGLIALGLAHPPIHLTHVSQ